MQLTNGYGCVTGDNSYRVSHAARGHAARGQVPPKVRAPIGIGRQVTRAVQRSALIFTSTTNFRLLICKVAMESAMFSVDGEEVEIPTCLVEDVSPLGYTCLNVKCASIRKLSYKCACPPQREIFSEVLSMDTWTRIMSEEEKQELEKLLPKIESHSSEDILK